MELSDAVRNRRIVRAFSDRPVPAELLDDVLAQALSAPTAGNSHGVDFVVLRGARETAMFWQATTTEDWWQRNPRRAGMRSAPVVLLPVSGPPPYLARYALEDKARSGLDRPEAWPIPFWFTDAAFATMIVLLRAVDAGLGAAFVGIFRGESSLLSGLGVPDGLRPLGAVLLGYPAPHQAPSASGLLPGRRRGERIHFGSW